MTHQVRKRDGVRGAGTLARDLVCCRPSFILENVDAVLDFGCGDATAKKSEDGG
jgi:hypothetical protein